MDIKANVVTSGVKEEFWKIESKDNRGIYGVRNFKLRNDSAVICIHGLTRDMHDHIFRNLSESFPVRGIDVIRYSLYGAEKDARKLNEAGFTQYKSDFRNVFNYFAQEYRTLFVVGHSFGGLIALSAQMKNVQAYSLWDPSYNTVEWPLFVKRHGHAMTMEVFGREYVYGSKLVHDFSRFSDEFCKTLAKKISAPIQIIFAGDGDLVKAEASYHTYARKSQKDIIKGATHLFSEQHCSRELSALTEGWFKKHATGHTL